jgi:hypothetical protein
MSQSVLTNKDQIPSDEIVFSFIGKHKALWISLFKYIHDQHPEINKEWRYYNDGKSWLLKVTKKAKTIFWLSVIEKTFRITFYFTDKAQQVIEKSQLSDELKEQFKSGKRYNKIRGITILFKNKKDCTYAEELIRIKLSIK